MKKSNVTRRVEGNVESAAGAVEKTVGQAIGNEHMEAEGAARQAEGNVRVGAAKAAERTKGAVEEVKGKVRKALNK
jgi:uncharacterized protein YjbJ (UPF0337 family)